MLTVCKRNTHHWASLLMAQPHNQLSCVAIVQAQCHILHFCLGLQLGKSQLKKSKLKKKDGDTDGSPSRCVFWNSIQSLSEVE